MQPIASSTFHRSHGASLLVVLILLLVMTVLGLTILRSTMLEERMSANLLDRSLAFQAAETALREGETLAALPATRANVPDPGEPCVGGLCPTPDASQPDRWMDNSFGGWVSAGTPVSALAAAPEFFVEYMGDAPTWPGCDLVDEASMSPLCMRPRYRITARSQAADRAAVVLQSNFIVQ